MSMTYLCNRAAKAVSLSWWLSSVAVLYYSALCGVACAILFILGLGVAGCIPPTKPYWDADTISHYYQDHITRIRAGAALLVISGGFYMPFSAAISYQMRRIPGLPCLIPQLQLASAAAGCWGFVLPGVVLAIASYRPDRPVEITQALNDFFWIVALMPWPTFMVQDFVISYSVIMDTRRQPLFPKQLAIVNLVVPILYTFATGMHTVQSGALAWDGALTFWCAGFSFCGLLTLDSIFLFLSVVREESREVNVVGEDIERGNCN